MSDRGKNNGGKFPKWIFLLTFVGLSPGIGMFIDFVLIFPPSAEAHGHGVPIFTILMPLIAIGLSVICLLIAGVRKASEMVAYRGKHYEYLKIFSQSKDKQAPAVTFHEIDLDAGRNSVRCIQVYRNRYVQCFLNHGVYTPVPPVQSMNGPFHQGAFVTVRQEFEDIWNSRRYFGSLGA